MSQRGKDESRCEWLAVIVGRWRAVGVPGTAVCNETRNRVRTAWQRALSATLRDMGMTGVIWKVSAGVKS